MIVNVNGGHSKYARGASGYLDEYDEDRKIVARLIPELKRRGCTVSDSSSEERTVNDDLYYQVRVANASGAELAVSVHLNAGGGRGAECFYFGGDARGYRIAADMSKRVAAALGLPNRGAKDGSNLYWVCNTYMTAVLLEVCFVDRKGDADAYNATSWDALIGAIADAVVAAPAPKPQAWKCPATEIDGADRYSTAQMIAQKSHPSTPYTVTAKGSEFPDALTAQCIAGALGARFGYADGPVSVSVSGADRYATNREAGAISEALAEISRDTVIVVPGDSFPDGMASAGYSYAQKVRIVLYEDSAEFRADVGRYRNIIVVGNSVPQIAGETERIAGSDRAETAAKWAEGKADSWATVYICSASGFADGIAGAQMVLNAPLLYAGYSSTVAALKRHAAEIDRLVIFGGYDSVTEAERKAVCGAAGID